MKFRVTHFELIVKDADPATAEQRIYAVHDRPAAHPAPQLLLTVSGPEIFHYLSKGAVLELTAPGETDGHRS
jgi:hypothetical protein